MSIRSLCSDSVVYKQTPSRTIGPSGGDDVVFSDGAALSCRFEEMSADEAVRYDARGERSLFTAYFAFDPAFTVDNRLKLTEWAGETISPPKFCRVLGQKKKASPGGRLSLWVVDCEEVTQRYEV